ncbi:ABC transporter substrate-binding protein [Paenibacillus yanchengensis]|uniref:ABC transporter substrate-binding protein n=1 Tax=Paenibacillus yanchengensis TaxID=2035833 RepID=A0ABW4YI00_9BACL
MYRKMLTVLLATILLLTACSGGGSKQKDGETSGNNAGKEKEITIWAWDKKFGIAAMELAIEKYTKEHPDVKINIVEYAQEDVVQKLNIAFSSKKESLLPTIILMEDYRAQSFLQTYNEFFYDLSDHVKGEDFAPYKLGPTNYDGKQYGVPFDSGVAGFYVRTDYLEQAGYTLNDLQNIDWQQFIEIGKAVKEKTGKEMITQDYNDLAFIRMMIQSAGVWYMEEDGETPYLQDNEVLKEALMTYKEIMNAGIVKLVSDWATYLAGFNNGDVAAVISGNWMVPSIKNQSDQAGKWGLAPIPKLRNVENSVNASNLGGSSWYVLNVDGKEIAADFLGKTLGSDVELYEDIVEQVGVVATYTPVMKSDAFSVADEYFAGQKLLESYGEWMELIPNVNYGKHTYFIEDILKVEIQNYLGGKSVEDTLKDAQALAESQLNK